VVDGLHGHSQEHASMVGLMTTQMPNAKAMDLVGKCFAFAVSTTLSRAISIGVGTVLHADRPRR